jgi:hypothetical protein
MIVFDIPTAAAGGRLRAAALGSCRVRQPLTALANQGQLRVVAAGLHKTHTARHALLLLEIVAGDVSIPPIALPFLFGKEWEPKPRNLLKVSHERTDVFIVEVCSTNQFFYLDTPLQENLVAEKLVKPHGRALLGWYRDVCLRGAADDACVEAALNNVQNPGFSFGTLEALLRGVRLRRQGVEDIARDVRAIQKRLGGVCLLVGPFVVDEGKGALMTERSALMASLRAAGDACGAPAFDPSPLVSQFGRKNVLVAGGRDVYHYAKSFLPVIGEALVRGMLEAVHDPRSRGPAASANIA